MALRETDQVSVSVIIEDSFFFQTNRAFVCVLMRVDVVIYRKEVIYVLLIDLKNFSNITAGN